MPETNQSRILGLGNTLITPSRVDRVLADIYNITWQSDAHGFR